MRVIPPGERAASFRIAAAVPGRVRLQFSEHGAGARWLPMLDAQLARLPDTIRVEKVPQARSMVARYPAARHDLASVVAVLESAARASLGEPGEDAAGPLDQLQREARAPERRPLLTVSQQHLIPGRLRVRVAGLRQRREIAPYLCAGLRKHAGVRSVEARPGSKSIIIRYDLDEVSPTSLLGAVRRLAAEASERAIRSVERAPEEPRSAAGLAPLLLSSLTVALAAAEAAPPLLLGGAVALAALPIAQRALAGAREGHIRLPQIDLAVLAFLAATGEFVTAGLTTGVIAAGQLITQGTMDRLRAEVTAGVIPAHPAAPAADWAAEWLLRAPLDDTRAQRWAADLDRQLALPLFGVAGLTYFLSRSPGQALAALKVIDLGAGIRVSAPVTVLHSLAAAAREGILFNGGHALEEFAQVDTIVIDPGGAGPGGDPEQRGALRSDTLAALVEPLFALGIRRVLLAQQDGWRELTAISHGELPHVRAPADPATLCRRLRVDGRRVALVGPGSATRSDATVSVLLHRGSAPPDAPADVVLLNGDTARLPRAIELAREAMRRLEQNRSVVAMPNALGLDLSVLGVLRSPASTIINTLATLAAVANGRRSFQGREELMIEG